MTIFALIFLISGDLYAAEKEKIRVAGSGGMIPLMDELAKIYMDEHKDVLIAVNQKSIQSAGGIMGAAKGELEIGMANRGLKDEEQSLGLEVTEIARVGIVIGVNKNVPIKEISSENLCKVYEGGIKKWSELGGGEGRIIAVTKSEIDATKETIRKTIPCFRNLKEAENVLLIPTSPEIAKILANSKSIGFTDTVSVDASYGAIIPLKLDGVDPNVDNIKSGKYKVVQTYRLVTKGKPGGKTRSFIDFIRGPKGRKIIESSNAVPSK